MAFVTVELPDDVAEALARLAGDRQSTPEALLSGWAKEATTFHADLASRLEEGLADLVDGRTEAHEEVMAELDSWAADVEARHRHAR